LNECWRLARRPDCSLLKEARFYLFYWENVLITEFAGFK